MIFNRPLVVSYGIGRDSTAMLVEMHKRGIRPDLILFADPGSEWPETYAYKHTMNEWLMAVGFPSITTVKYVPPIAPYKDLYSKCITNQTLPSLAFNGHSCALVFKRDPQVKFLKTWQPAIDCINAGKRIIKAVGYDNGKRDTKRSEKFSKSTDRMRAQISERAECNKKPLSTQWEAANCDFWYPLQEWELDREVLPDIIKSAGLPVPRKSACTFCPATTPREVVELKNKHPDEYNKAVEMERVARDGKHGLKKKAGLGMGGKNKETGLSGWSWKWLQDCDDPTMAAEYLKEHGAKITEILRP